MCCCCVVAGLYLLANCFCYASCIVLNRLIAQELGPLTIVAWGFLAAFPVNFVFAVAASNPHPVSEFPAIVWIALLYSSQLGGVLAFGLNAFATKHTLASVVTIYLCVQPVTSSLFGAIFLGERCAELQLLCFARSH